MRLPGRRHLFLGYQFPRFPGIDTLTGARVRERIGRSALIPPVGSAVAGLARGGAPIRDEVIAGLNGWLDRVTDGSGRRG